MSWSVSAIGKTKAVAAAVAKAIAASKCQEPEESIKNACGAVIASSLASMPENMAIRVEASGSMYFVDGKGGQNNVSIKVEPIYGFIDEVPAA